MGTLTQSDDVKKEFIPVKVGTRNKIVTALIICSQLDVIPGDLCRKYENTNFVNSSISKKKTFLQILKDKSISRVKSI